MSALSNRLRNAPQVVRILLLPATVLLVLLLVVLVVLQYAVPGTGRAQTSLQTATAFPISTESAEPAETSIPTQTLVLQKTPTPRATQTLRPAIAAEVAEPEGTIQVSPSPEMQILEEPTGPASTSAAPTAAESPPILSPSGQLGNVLRNGDFEQGFQPNGVDDIRLVGPTLAVAASGELVAPGGVVTGSELVAASEMVAIPVTGEAPTTSRSSLPMWVTVAFLSLLLGGATWRLVWKQM